MTPAQTAIVEHAKACEDFCTLAVQACDAGNLQSCQDALDFAELHSGAAFAVAAGVLERAA